MKNRFTMNQRAQHTTGCGGSATAWPTCFLALALAFASLGAPPAGAEEATRIAQAGDPGPQASASDPPNEPAPAARQAPPNTGIEEIIVSGSESEGTSDFETADSVTGFGAEDLAALGAQDIADIAAFTPNLEIVTSGATTPTFFIRGVGLNDFNSNSTGAVAIYQDDVARNAPALQLSTLFDVEAVNVLRGPQGTGLARNASAGAIKIYSRKPTGEFGGFLRSELGNFNFRDFEGALEFPIYKDLLSSRLAFRFSERDGTMKNRCGNADPFGKRVPVPRTRILRDDLALLNTDPDWSQCGEPVERFPRLENKSTIPEGLPSRLNDIGNWAARGTVLLQPTLDMSWLLNAHGSRRDEWSRVGQAIGTRGFFCDDDPENCGIGEPDRVDGVLGGSQGLGNLGYQAKEVRARLLELAPCKKGAPKDLPDRFIGSPEGTCHETVEGRKTLNDAKIQLAKELARDLDSEPWAGDFNLCGTALDPDTGEFRDRDPTGLRCKKDKGRTTNDTWGVYLKGDMVLPLGMQLTSISGYDSYDRLIDIDLDFSPETLFEIATDDEGWQVTQDLKLQGQLGDEAVLRWEVGGWFLRERLDVLVKNDLGAFTLFAVGAREYTQDVYSAAGYGSLAFDFWDDFTLDGGFRYNWEEKRLDYALTNTVCQPCIEQPNDVWSAPTGTVRLTYRFRDDTHVFWKYTRGWKPGTYNATSSAQQGVSIADPETIDAFETGVRGSWLEGRLGLDF